MTCFEVLSLVISGLSFIAAGLAACAAVKANGKSEEANKLSEKANKTSEEANRLSKEANKSAEASVEMSLFSEINSTKEKIMDCTESMEGLKAKKTLTAEEKRLLDFKEQRFRVALENNLNAYNEACAKYLDGKIDKVRFKKSYHSEIQNIVQNQNLKKYFEGPASKYKAVLKVFDEWFNLEK